MKTESMSSRRMAAKVNNYIERILKLKVKIDNTRLEELAVEFEQLPRTKKKFYESFEHYIYKILVREHRATVSTKNDIIRRLNK